MFHATKAWIDTYLAKISMYLLITLALIVLFGIAFVYALLGVIAFQPVDIVICLAVFMGVAYGASHMFAYLFGVSAQHKSAFITGGILFCLFSPVATLSNILIYSLIAVLAIATKYLLVWRGRHIFNPAAASAVIASLIGVQFASWWIADAMYAIPVALCALLILYKTERLQFAGVFFSVYAITIAVVAVFGGQPPLESIVGAFTGSWWPLFFAGFMLSEPLTLPPRRYQLFIVATIVAVLIPLHLSFDRVALTPEIALIIGNIAAFIMAHRAGISLVLTRRTQFEGRQELLEFTPRRPLQFEAGQYLEMTLPHGKTDLRGERRMFTIASAPEAKTVKIATRYADRSSVFKEDLRRFNIGHVISATAVRGDFLLPKDPTRKLLFIAGGIGITPFRSFVESLRERGETRDVVLLYAVRSKKEALFGDVFLQDLTWLKTIIIAPDGGSQGTVQGTRIDAALIQDEVKDISERDVYVSGPPQMVASVSAIAKDLGARRVKRDSFAGY